MDLKPVSALTNTGKNVIKKVIKILGEYPNPNQITINGAIATIGVTLTIKAIGYIDLSNRSLCTIKKARKIEKVIPRRNPENASANVMAVFCKKNIGS